MKELGINQEMVDKFRSIIDNIDIRNEDEKTVIEIKMKNITIVIDK